MIQSFKRQILHKLPLIGLLLFFSTIASAQQDYIWHNPTYINGVCEQDTVNIFHRLPAVLKDKVRPEVWNLSLNTAGEYIDFSTDAEDITVKYIITGNVSMPHMPATGASGVALWAIDRDGLWKWAPGTYRFGDTVTYTFHNLVFPKNGLGNFRLYLPLYNTVRWLNIGVKKDKKFVFTPKSADKPIIAYGTSIMQGAVASRPDLAWTNILNRALDRPVINLGFSGNGRIEAPVIDLMATVNAKMYIIDCMPNLTKNYKITRADIAGRIRYAIKKLREQNKDVPILFATHSGGYATDYLDTARANLYKQSSKLLTGIFNELNTEGTKNIYLLTDKEIGFDATSTAEGLHPNDIGMMQYAKAYENKIRQILSEPKGELKTTIPIEQSRDSYNWIGRHEQVLGNIKRDPPRVVIIGNSIIHYWSGKPEAKYIRGDSSWQKYMEPLHTQNLGFGWDRIENALWRVYHGELDGYQARKVLLMIGTNNLESNTDEEMLAGYRALISAIKMRQPYAEIIISAILPRRAMEQRVVNLNSKLKKMASAIHVRYADVGRVLLGSDKKTNEALFVDGLHPNEKGYELIGTQLYPILN